ncbi:helix-turn-helix domain-containing protein [Lichenibacterium ramalinae]|uniref:XRE family transcriptional regulator n=1 Tax=Lichenibacterium ramalinae TaxID=2316527 RepID=A0A4Q2R9K5_9HYPH|nr:helix-turn-helix transcriptional regulator [Lichenibacterium ramalinae]RYB03365.1 XRE family transcriptional regulator [Lichenibacterium ramalinae]
MNAIQPIARTEDTVTLRLVDYEALIAAAEDVEDIATLYTAEAREKVLGKDAARADNLSDELVGRLLDREHPIRIWREHRGLTSQALADAAGVSRSYLAEIEGKKKPGSVQAFRALAAALKVPVDELFFEAE